MTREIRITVDDDEVFERMKARKQQLDLSWEEVLHRGLRRPGERGQTRRQEELRGDRGRPADPLESPGDFAEDLKRQIQNQVRESVRSSVEPAVDDPFGDDPLGSEVSTLESAEDAVLRFDFLGDDAGESRNQVPLRVTLEASTDGLDADVVAVRQGRDAASMNRFDAAVRRRIVEGLATGDLATLAFDAGDESYRVVPRLSWSRQDGQPTVVEVTIDEVRFDDA